MSDVAAPPVPWYQTKDTSGETFTPWFQGRLISSKFHLVRADEPWAGYNVKTACGRHINQFDQWEKPGLPGSEWGDQESYCCPRCLTIMQRDDPERYQRSVTYVNDLYAWIEAYRIDDPDARGPKPAAP